MNGLKKLGEASSLLSENDSKLNDVNFNSPHKIQQQMQSEIENIALNKNNEKKVSESQNEESKEISSVVNLVNLETLSTSFKNMYEHFALVSLSIWNKLKVNEQDDFPFDKNSKIYNFYVNVFPYFKLICLILFVLVIYYATISIIKTLFMNKSK